MTLNVRSFALSLGILYGLTIFITTLWLIFNSSPNDKILFELIYPGYSVSLQGSIVGLLYGFIDGVIAGTLLSWLYNYFLISNSK